MHSNNKIIFILITLLIISSCDEEVKKSEEVVRINDAVLTEDDLQKELSNLSNYGKHREEFINEWIEQQILYQEAVEEGIINESRYNSIIERSKKKLASALLIEKIISENNYEPGIDELKKYYEEYIDDFRLDNNGYKVNVAYFNNFETAKKFRSVLIESDWNKALSAYRAESSLLESVTSEIFSEYQLQPMSIQKTVSVLQPGEISIVVEAEPMKFAVVQLLEKLNKGDIPQFETIVNQVKERYKIVKNRSLIKQYIDQLIEDHNIEIKRYNE